MKTKKTAIAKQDAKKNRPISQAEYARRRGVSAQYISKLIKAGKLAARHGKIDAAAADRALEELKDPARGKNGASALADGKTQRDKGGGYAAARTQRETYQALLKKAEYERVKGKLLDRNEVLKTWSGALICLRQALEKIPARCCAKCRGAVDHAIGAALDELADGGVTGDGKSAGA